MNNAVLMIPVHKHHHQITHQSLTRIKVNDEPETKMMAMAIIPIKLTDRSGCTAPCHHLNHVRQECQLQSHLVRRFARHWICQSEAPKKHRRHFVGSILESCTSLSIMMRCCSTAEPRIMT